MFLIRMIGLYGDPERIAYYRASGDLWNFAPDAERATRFSDPDEILSIIEHSDFYCKQFNAERLEIVPLRGF